MTFTAPVVGAAEVGSLWHTAAANLGNQWELAAAFDTIRAAVRHQLSTDPWLLADDDRVVVLDHATFSALAELSGVRAANSRPTSTSPGTGAPVS